MEHGRTGPIIRPIDVAPLSPEEIPDNVHNLRNHVMNVALPRGDLRRGQREALLSTVKFLESGGRAGYVEQVSGYGKSRYLEEIGNGFGGVQLYITPDETASNNIAQKLKGKADFGEFNEDKKELGHTVTIARMPSIQALFKRIVRGDRLAIEQGRLLFSSDLIFPDELHHYLTPARLEVLTTFLRFNPRAIMIGATASDKYNVDKSSEKQFGKCLHRVTIAEGVDEGVLLSPHVKIARTGLSLNGIAKVNPEGNFVFHKDTPLKARDKVLIDAYLEASKEEGKMLRSVSYLTSIEHAQNFLELCQEMGIRGELIVGATTNRDKIYKRLFEGKLDTVATVMTAIESLDLPWLEAILDGAPTRSWRVANQKWPRPMRNMEGKKAPWIIQAVDEHTFSAGRPLVVPEILGIYRFNNGAIVGPANDENLSASQFLDIERNYLGTTYSAGAAVELVEGKDVTVDVIDINSLFKIGLCDRARLLGEGLLPESESEALRQRIQDAIQTKYRDGKVPTFEQGLKSLKIYDEVIDDYTSINQIVARLCGYESVRNLRAEQANALLDFLSTGKFARPDNASVGEKVQFVSETFAQLCERYRLNDIDGCEKEELAEEIRNMIKDLPFGDIDSSTANHFWIEGTNFAGTITDLSKALGISGIRRVRFSEASKKRILDFVNAYSEGEKLGFEPEPVVEDFPIVPSAHKRIGYVQPYLESIFSQARNMGWDIGSEMTMDVYKINTPQFSGSINDLALELGIKKSARIPLSSTELQSLLYKSGIQI